MRKVTLPNGLTVLYKKQEGKALSIQLTVGVGSNHEKKSQKGIAHIIEHLLFEGTDKRPRNSDISNEIERLGGEFNAYTVNWRTVYYIHILSKHASVAFDVLSDIVANSLFRQSDFERERDVVLKEIDMINDNPQSYLWILLHQKLFSANEAKHPVYGYKEILKSLSLEEVKAFFQKYYVPSNMQLTIVGDLASWKQLAKKQFSSLKKMPKPRHAKAKEKVITKSTQYSEKRQIQSSYLTIAYRTVPREHKDSYALDVLEAILSRGQSGTLFRVIRGKHGLAYDVGAEHVADVDYGYFALYASASKTKFPAIKKLLLEELSKLESVTAKQLKEAKTFLEGDLLLSLESTQKVAEQLSFWNQVSDAKDQAKYIKRIREVTEKDIKRVLKKYLRHHCQVSLLGK